MSGTNMVIIIAEMAATARFMYFFSFDWTVKIIHLKYGTAFIREIFFDCEKRPTWRHTPPISRHRFDKEKDAAKNTRADGQFLLLEVYFLKEKTERLISYCGFFVDRYLWSWRRFWEGTANKDQLECVTPADTDKSAVTVWTTTKLKCGRGNEDDPQSVL